MTDRKNKHQSQSSTEQTDTPSGRKKNKLYDVSIFYAWCKACGICSAFCPKKIIKEEKTGIPRIDNPDSCTGCRFCEKHCPDFAITVDERMPKRRKTDE
jgi:2-oxoglutarate ferredoxin oxidoreductase subunit delta